MNLRQIIQEEMAHLREPSIETLQKRVTKRIMSEGIVEEALSEALKWRISQVVTNSRQPQGVHSLEGAAPSRWKAYVPNLTEHFHPIMRRWEYVEGVYKFLGDCTQEDLWLIVHDRNRRAADMVEKAEAYAEVANLMAYAGAGTVAELDGDKVAEVLK